MNYTYWLKQIENKLKQNKGSRVVGVFDSGIGGLWTIPTLINKNPKK